MSKPVLIFRADAGNQIGTGHLVRSAALAGLLSNDFDCKLITSCSIPAMLEHVHSNFSVVKQVAEKKEELGTFLQLTDRNRLAVLDGYAFDKHYQNALIHEDFRVAVIDDLITAPIAADLVINHCGGIGPLNYFAEPPTVFGLGTSYLLVNPIFSLPLSQRRTSIQDYSCFLCLGGADPNNDTLTIIKEISEKNIFDAIHVVTGAAYLYKGALTEFAKDKNIIRLYQSITADQVKEVMLQCSFAICSPSTVVYEYLSIGGIVWLKQIADNQKNILQFLTRGGIAYAYQAKDISVDKNFDSIFCQQAKYFDGLSSERLKKLFKSWFFSTQLEIRRAEKADLHTCYNWANDPEARSQSYVPEQVSLEKHTAWFTQKLKDQNCYYYILLLQSKPVAQIRFDVAHRKATISYLTDAQFRNKGMGPWVLSKAIQQLLSVTALAEITGHVKKENIASQRAFEKLAFEKVENHTYPDSFTYTMKINGD